MHLGESNSKRITASPHSQKVERKDFLTGYIFFPFLRKKKTFINFQMPAKVMQLER